MKGWIYIITNKSMPGLIKIGYSTKDPKLRAGELGTGSAYSYEVIYDILTVNPREIELQIHKVLSDYREGKEWFNCSIEVAIHTIRKIVGEKKIVEEFNDYTYERLEKSQESKKTEKQYEIIKKYEEIILSEFPQRSFGKYWFFSMIIILIMFLLLIQISDDKDYAGSVVSLAIFLGAIIAYLLKKILRFKDCNSTAYKRLIDKRNAELSAEQ